MSLEHLPQNPDYGSGCFRRRVAFRCNDGAVLATVDDTHHAMWLLLTHANGLVSTVDAEITRGPATTCSGSVAGLDALVGLQLAVWPGRTVLPPVHNCTHLADLAAWSFQIALEDETSVVFDVAVPDQGPPVNATVIRNGKLEHEWLIHGERILAPDKLELRPLMKGFAGWAQRDFKGRTLMAAQVLQRGIFVSRGRRHLVDRQAVPLKESAGMADACYSYSGDRFETATSNIGYVRDFTVAVETAAVPSHILDRFEGCANDHN